MSSKRPLVAAFIAPALALVAGLGCWLLQGSGNLYTSTDKRFYLPDPDLGWRLAPETYLWLGLDALAAIVGFAAALAAGALLIRWREQKAAADMPRMRAALLVASVLPAVIPIAGFAGGSPPADAAERVPDRSLVVASGIEASLGGAPAGVYRAIEHPGTLISARIEAGGDTFEARFSRGVRGQWRGDPGDLTQPMSGELAVGTASIETGIALRNRHAAEKLQSEKHPELLFSLTRITGTSAVGDRVIAFSGEGVVTIMGTSIPTDVNGTVTVLDRAGKRRLELAAKAVLVVNANLQVDLAQTPVDTSGGTFDVLAVPIRVSLILVNEGES